MTTNKIFKITVEINNKNLKLNKDNCSRGNFEIGAGLFSQYKTKNIN